MTIINRLATIPEKYFVLIFLGIFLITGFSTYFSIQDTRILEKKIRAKQKDLFETLQLKDAYEAKKRATERLGGKKTERKDISLGLIEETVAKSFVSGKLATLQPTHTKEEKGQQHMTIDVKVAGAALAEVIAFVKAVESSGLYVEKMRLSTPAANPSTLDMQATVKERYLHG
jgi:hypothetical protein